MLNNPLPRLDESLRNEIKAAFNSQNHKELLRLVTENNIYRVGCATCVSSPENHLRSWIGYLIAYNFEPPKYKLYDRPKAN